MRSFKTADIEERAFRVIQASLPPESFSVLMQVRRTLEVGDLLPSVLEHGQQTPGVAIVLTPGEAKKYIGELNEIFGAQHTLDELTLVWLDGRRRYFVLVAGHRRLETCLHINQLVGEGKCEFTEKYNGKYRVELRFDLTTAEAIALQFNENRHMPVPPHEEAQAAWGFWTWLKRRQADLTITEYARVIGRSTDWVRSALRFCDLPLSVQEYVDGSNGMPKIPYGILVQLSRLAEGYEELMGEPLPQDAYHHWLRTAVLKRLNTSDFGKLVSDFLRQKQEEIQGQYPLFGGVDLVIEDKRPVRRIVAPQMVRDLWQFLEYMRVVMIFQKTGQFGAESPLGPEPDPHIRTTYSPGSPLRLISKLVGLHHHILPHLIEIAEREGGRHRRALIGQRDLVFAVRNVSEVLAAYEEKLSDTD